MRLVELCNFELNQSKVELVAKVAKFLVDSDLVNQNESLSYQLISEGIRKIHDYAICFRGKGKYLGHPYWSNKALKLLKENNGKVQGIQKFLSHEHVIPVSMVVKGKLFKLKKGTDIGDYIKIINDYSVVAIITREENKMLSNKGYGNKLPKDSDEKDIFGRYRKVGFIDHLNPHPDEI